MGRTAARHWKIGILVAGLLAAAVAGCARDKTAEEMLALDFWGFDQSLETGWRPYAERGAYKRAADLIDYYLGHRSDLLEAHRGYLHLHAGELRAFHGDTRRALAHLELAYVEPDSMPDRFPRSFNDLAAGTRAFLTGDMAGVRASAAAIRALPGLTARDSMFLKSLDHLATQEGKPFLEAEFSTPE